MIWYYPSLIAGIKRLGHSLGKIEKFETISRRPVNSTARQLAAFISIVHESGEVPIENLKRGVAMAEMLFFTVTEKNAIAGVSAIRFQNRVYHKHLFEKAGVPEMFNPHSVESCWLSIRPDYRGNGVWKRNRQARLDYLGNRPCHVVRRADNKFLDNKKSIYWQAGHDFYSDTSDDKLMLLVYNHDEDLDKNKRLKYV